MTWEDILKRVSLTERRSLRAVKDDKKTKPTVLDVGLPKPKKMRTAPISARSIPQSRKVSKPKQESSGEGGESGDDVGESLSEIRAKFLRNPRGLYSELSDKESRLSAKSREEAQDQKKILGYIRKLIREANIPEANYK